MALLHLGAVAALFVFSWRALLAAIVLWWISVSLGVGMGFHRLLTHRGYRKQCAVVHIVINSKATQPNLLTIVVETFYMCDGAHTVMPMLS